MKLPENFKTKHLVILGIGGAILTTLIIKIIRDRVRTGTASRSYDSVNGSIASQLSNALFPDGRPSNEKPSFTDRLMPFSGYLDKIVNYFGADPDYDKLFQLAGSQLTPENFKSVSKAYNRLYNADLLLELEKRLDERFNEFDNKMRNYQLNLDPERNASIIKALARNIFDDLDKWYKPADSDLYKQLNQVNDTDLEAVYREFETILRANGEEGTLYTWLDNTTFIGRSDDIMKRLNLLGLI